MAKAMNMIGEVFGNLTVLERGKTDQNRKIYWICQCSCGNTTESRGDHLRAGRIKSCGCLNRKLTSDRNTVDEVGNVYGLLTVLSRSENKKDGCRHVRWNCKCECGSFVEVDGTLLRSGTTKSCGCVQSFGERAISEYLDRNNFTYSKEYSFSDLVSDKQTRLRFDFAIFNDGKLDRLIEFDGEQHYIKTNQYYSERLVKHDQLKDEYCLKNNIPLIRLRREDLGNLKAIVR